MSSLSLPSTDGDPVPAPSLPKRQVLFKRKETGAAPLHVYGQADREGGDPVETQRLTMAALSDGTDAFAP